jgi:hypothetical protein
VAADLSSPSPSFIPIIIKKSSDYQINISKSALQSNNRVRCTEAIKGTDRRSSQDILNILVLSRTCYSMNRI